MAILYFSDILQKIGLDPKKVKLIRHSFTNKHFRICHAKNMVYDYTCVQSHDFGKFDYWAVFIAVGGTKAKLFGLYRAYGCIPATREVMPKDYPCEEMYTGKQFHYFLEPLDLLKEYENRLIIDWGSATRSWHQKGTIQKPVVSISDTLKIPFPGFEELIVTYPQLCKIVSDEAEEYSEWRSAMKAVNAVYLILDVENKQQYVGSTYNEDGLLGRWQTYVKTNGTGGNEGLKNLLNLHPELRDKLQFSILQVLSKNKPNEEVLKAEGVWKEKLGSRVIGLNQN